MNKDNRLLEEAYKKVAKSKKLGDITSFEGLPDNIPYGFCVYGDGSEDGCERFHRLRLLDYL